MKIGELAGLLIGTELIGDGETEIIGIEMHSLKVKQGDLFVCTPGIPGFLEDRAAYADDAVRRGAKAIVAERRLELEVPVPQLIVKDARYAMAVFSAHIYGCPSREMKLIGVTGTNGKTTTVFLLEAILADFGWGTGRMGNLGVKIGEELIPADINTHEPPSLQKHLRMMRDRGVQAAVIEASSQGIDLGRVIGCEFRTAIFTNLTQDHLDYHGSMEAYLAAKGLLFARLGNAASLRPEERKYAVLNADDPASAYLRKQTAAEVVTYAIENDADVKASDLSLSAEGTVFAVLTWAGKETITLPLIGRFNVYNALAAIAAALVEGIPLSAIRDALARISAVDGRMEMVRCGQPFAVLVDYAHTPDGLEKALATIREAAGGGRIIAVFGCGGNRDRAKRPVMGRIASTYADYVVITSDNPRKEEPWQIMRDIEQGIDGRGAPGRYAMLADRRDAIFEAIRMAEPGDTVFIAGKGHETYQIIGGETHHFDDREVAAEAIMDRMGCS
jgi:UDP-N-acetylmuramoyl-L-alanyl-D-glutamate--2,6-diaminopimelate ligase